MSRDSQKQQDAAFQRNQEHNARIEEEAHLESTKKQITQQIDDLDRQISKLVKSFSGMIIDNEDRDQAHWDRNECTKLENQCNTWEAKKAQPYKYRINVEFTENGNLVSKTYYVGVSPIVINEHEIVLCWTSDMGMFALNHNSEAAVGGVPCKKTLRRVFDIQKGELKEFHDTLGKNAKQNETSYIDPFLLRLIKDERREHATNTIIGSISQMQFDIISKPYDSNFIVQGCAGSGKTQIMLHRLSYLLANHSKLSSTNVRIISPSEIYKAFINLEKEILSIDTIDSMTFEEYYIDLVRKYDSNYMATLPLFDERKVFGNAISVIYKSSNVFIELYNSCFAEVLHQLSIDKLNGIIRKSTGSEISFNGYTARTARSIIQTIYQAISTWDWKVHERNNLFKKAQEAETALEIYQTRFENIREQLRMATSQLKIWTQAEQKALQNKTEKYTQYRHIQKQINDNESKLLSMRKEMESMSSIASQLPSYITSFPKKSFQSYEIIINLSDPIAIKIHTLLSGLSRQINSLAKEYLISPSSQIKEQSERLKSQYCESFNKYVAGVYNKYVASKEENQHLAEHISQIEKQQEEFRKQLRSLLTYLDKNEVKKRLAIIQQLLQALDSSESVKLPGKDLPKVYKKKIQDYASLRSSYNKNLQTLNSVSHSIESIRTTLKSPIMEEMTDDEQNYLRECYQIAKKLEFDNILSSLMEAPILEPLKQQDKAYNTRCYRHKLYLRLLCCYLYNGPLLHGDAYLCIDEAQDAAPSEYDLLRNVLGPSCVFNLYGDVHQSIHQGHSIRNWADLSRHKMEVLELDYNYRNTVEITEFCNREFHMNVKPIGITGEPVAIKTLNAAIQEAIQFQKQDAKRTVAILYHYGEQSTSNMLYRLLDPAIMSWDKVQAGKISILSATSAKGLEFDLAVVIPAGMVDNEKYIAYTRAVEQLIIVRA